MDCKNHPDVPAVDRCAGCSEAFCYNCLVAIQGRKYCGACKVLTIQGQPMLIEETFPCKEAKDALILGIIGLTCVCLGIIFGPIAIVKSLKAKGIIAANPHLSGGGLATAALIIGIISLILWVVFLIGYATAASRAG